VKVELTGRAAERLEAQRDYYRELAGDETAQRFLDDFLRTVRTLQTFPYGGRRTDRELRLAPLRRYPFSLVYQVEDERIAVLTIVHDRQDRASWGLDQPR
jgi:plasmid stabilization system protein ParE